MNKTLLLYVSILLPAMCFSGNTDRIVRDGALTNAVFQVNNQGKKVCFSQGNLQYQPRTGTWRFAEHQYDIIGYTSYMQRDNINIYARWIDMFSWGTGNNPTSKNDEDFNTFTDWGVNKISNGGNIVTVWRTLTKDEWEYLLENSCSLKKCVSIDEINGYMLLPLDFRSPSRIDLSQNGFTSIEWQQLEEYGAVFLPAVGQGCNGGVKGVGEYGVYWSSSSDVNKHDVIVAWGFAFDIGVTPTESFGLYSLWRPHAVRLVQEVEEEEDIVFSVVEDMPEFPGGQQALFKYLSENILYPEIAKEHGIQGRVICQFIVNKNGSITDIEIIRSSGDPSLDKEAIRVIQSMPEWKPGKQRGKAVRVKYTVPVNFKLQ